MALGVAVIIRGRRQFEIWRRLKCFKPCARTSTEASATVSEVQVIHSQVITRILSEIGLQLLSSHHQPIFAWRNNPLVGSAVASRFITLPTTRRRGTLE